MAETPPKKKRKIVHEQKFIEEYSRAFPVFVKSKRSEHSGYCTICSSDVNVSHGGKHDLLKHVAGKKHTELARLQNSNSKLTSAFVKTNDFSVIRAEVTFTNFIVENNLPIAVADNAGKLFRKMFPDSECAAKYGCGRTKTTAILHTLAKDDDKEMTKILQQSPFSVATDGSNDFADKKLYPIVVRYFDSSSGRVLTNNFCMPELTIASTGENIFRLIV